MSADGEDPRSLLLASLDLPNCRIEFSGAPIVLLCGGKVNFKTIAHDPAPAQASLRHAITDFHTAFEIFRPEEITDWQDNAVFKDLMRFELELASVCSLVVIILESEGALVELGAFSQLPELSEKIVAICPSQFMNSASFINFGVLRFIAQKNPTNVKSYPWEPTKPADIPQEVIEDVAADIQQELDKLPQSQVLKADRNSHVMVLICELLRLFTALKEHEILEYLELLGVKTTKEALRGKLFLLQRFRLIKTQDYSDALFFMHGKESSHRLRLTPKDKEKPIDILRFETQCLEYYKNNPKQRNRNRAISQAAKEASK
jgi:hypothetical protein